MANRTETAGNEPKVSPPLPASFGRRSNVSKGHGAAGHFPDAQRGAPGIHSQFRGHGSLQPLLRIGGRSVFRGQRDPGFALSVDEPDPAAHRSLASRKPGRTVEEGIEKIEPRELSAPVGAGADRIPHGRAADSGRVVGGDTALETGSNRRSGRFAEDRERSGAPGEGCRTDGRPPSRLEEQLPREARVPLVAVRVDPQFSNGRSGEAVDPDAPEIFRFLFGRRRRLAAQRHPGKSFDRRQELHPRERGGPARVDPLPQTERQASRRDRSGVKLPAEEIRERDANPAVVDTKFPFHVRIAAPEPQPADSDDAGPGGGSLAVFEEQPLRMAVQPRPKRPAAKDPRGPDHRPEPEREQQHGDARDREEHDFQRPKSASLHSDSQSKPRASRVAVAQPVHLPIDRDWNASRKKEK